jgi:hypothetical protein
LLDDDADELFAGAGGDGGAAVLFAAAGVGATPLATDADVVAERLATEVAAGAVAALLWTEALVDADDVAGAEVAG